VRKILAACNRTAPTEEVVVRLLVGAGLRASQPCGLAVVGPDGLPDLMSDSLTRALSSCVCAGTQGEGPEGATGADHAEAGRDRQAA
jgi:hypothetical protein